MPEKQMFHVNRTLDYTITQGFLVIADDQEQAEERVSDFVDSDWTDETAASMGLVQVSDSMEQIENSQDIVADKDPVDPATAAVEDSMGDLILENQAAEMFAMLREIAARPQMYTTGISDIGLKTKDLVDRIEAEMNSPKAVLAALQQPAK